MSLVHPLPHSHVVSICQANMPCSCGLNPGRYHHPGRRRTSTKFSLLSVAPLLLQHLSHYPLSTVRTVASVCIWGLGRDKVLNVRLH